MTGKRFSLFDECAARCVHLFPQEEQCTSFNWGDPKMYTESAKWNKRMWHYSQNKDLSWILIQGYKLGDLIWKIAKILWWWNFFLHLRQDKPLQVQLKTNEGVIFISILLRFHCFISFETPRNMKYFFQEFHQLLVECTSCKLPISSNLQFQFQERLCKCIYLGF